CYAYTEKSHGRLISKRFFKANFEELEKFDLYDKFKKVWKNISRWRALTELAGVCGSFVCGG
ncbi:MAG: hypothetical protein II381_02245, partial [Victivallales bacterium]|nr:hypothetical protein [Victivallales bacterium]